MYLFVCNLLYMFYRNIPIELNCIEHNIHINLCSIICASNTIYTITSAKWFVNRTLYAPNQGTMLHVMVFILDGCSFHYAHTWSKTGFSICWRNLVTSKESSNPIFFSRKNTLFSSFVRIVKPSNITTMRQTERLKTLWVNCLPEL